MKRKKKPKKSKFFFLSFLLFPFPFFIFFRCLIVRTTQVRVNQYKLVRYFFEIFASGVSNEFMKKVIEHVIADLEVVKEDTRPVVRISTVWFFSLCSFYRFSFLFFSSFFSFLPRCLLAPYVFPSPFFLSWFLFFVSFLLFWKFN